MIDTSRIKSKRDRMFIFGNYQKLVENFGTFELEKSMEVPSTTI